ncbi:MAG: hypothetical protein KC619_23455 [Myxococcales bacterium]|nr:hypothetical protein [Myxococcales bacterium]
MHRAADAGERARTEARLRQLERGLEGLADEPLTPLTRAQYERRLDELEAYLYLTGPAEPDEPAFDRAARGRVFATLGGGPSLAKWLGRFGAGREERFERHQGLAEQARAELARREMSQVEAWVLAERCVPDRAPFVLGEILGIENRWLTARDDVPRAGYLRACYVEAIEPITRPPDARERWLTRMATETIEARAELRSTYLHAFVTEWRDLLRSLRFTLPRVAALDDAHAMLSWLTASPSPLRRLYVFVHQETDLPGPATVSDVHLSASHVRTVFSDLGWLEPDDLAELEALLTSLRDALDDPTARAAVIDRADRRLEEIRERRARAWRARETGYPPPWAAVHDALHAGPFEMARRLPR